MRIRLSAVTGIAAGLLLLAGCQNDPSVVAYVGDTAIPESQLTELVDEYNAKVDEFNAKAEAAAKAEGKEIPTKANHAARDAAAHELVLHELCRQLSVKKGFTYSAPEIAAGAPRLIVLAEEAEACADAVPADTASVTEDDVHRLFDRAVAAGQLPAGITWEAEKANFMQDQRILEGVAKEKALATAAKVRMNPLYGDVVLRFLRPEIAERVGASDPGVVTDRPVTTPTQQQ